MGRAFSNEEKEVLRSKMIKEGIKAFKTVPYENVKIDVIAQRVGIAKGTFYLFFKSKTLLYQQCIMAYEQEIQGRLITEIKKINKPMDRLKKSLYLMIDLIQTEPLIRRIQEDKQLKKLTEKRTEEDLTQLLSTDEHFLRMIISPELTLKVSDEMAVELMRSLFYVVMSDPPLQVDKKQYYHHLINGIIHEIIQEEVQ